MSDTQPDQPPNKLAEGVPPHTSHYACDERVALYGDKTIGCCCTGHMCEPKDQPVDEPLRDKCALVQMKLGIDDPKWKELIGNDGGLLGFIQAECNRARLMELEQLPPHTTKLGYSYLVDRIAELQQLMKGQG